MQSIFRTGRPLVQPAGEETALAEIVRSSHDAVIAKTAAGTVTAWNEGAELLYGFTAQQMVGQNIEAIIPPDMSLEERARHARVAKGTAESGYRCVRLHSSGDRLEVVMSMSPVRDQRGDVVAVASISRPVSDRERAEARFAALLEAAPDAILCVDKNGRIVFANAQVGPTFGYPPDDLIGQLVEVLMPSALRERHVEHRTEYHQAPHHRAMVPELDLRGQRKDGSTFPVEISLTPGNANDGEMVFAAVRDVTQQRAIEAAARENETRLRQLAESVAIVFILEQIEPPAYLYVSPGCHEILGCSPEQLSARPDLGKGLFHPDDPEGVSTQNRESGAPETSEHRIVRSDGSTRWVRTTITPVPRPGGPPERRVITVEDITVRIEAAEALREAEAAARAANEAKSEFLSRMSHELRTPLNAVLGFGQLLERQLKDTVHAEAVGYILKGGRHLLSLINDVLDIATIESGDMSLSIEPLDLRDVVLETVELMVPLAANAGVRLRTTVHGGATFVHADRQRLRQIMLNLLSNAVKYNRPHGNVWVELAAQEGDLVEVRVCDDGPGVPARSGQPVVHALRPAGSGVLRRRGHGHRPGPDPLPRPAHGRRRPTGITSRGRLHRGGHAAPQRAGRHRRPGVGSGAHRTRRCRPPARDTCSTSRTTSPTSGSSSTCSSCAPAGQLIHAGLGSLGLELARAHQPNVILLDLHLPDRSGLRRAGRAAGRPAHPRPAGRHPQRGRQRVAGQTTAGGRRRRST